MFVNLSYFLTSYKDFIFVTLILIGTVCTIVKDILLSQNELEVKHKDEIKQLKNQLDKTDNRKIEEQHKTISTLSEENKNVNNIYIIFNKFFILFLYVNLVKKTY